MDRSRRAARWGAPSRVGIASSIQPWPMPAIVANLSLVERLPAGRNVQSGNLEAYKPQAAPDCKSKWRSCFAAERANA